MKTMSALASLLLAAGLASAARAQDMATLGDWRHLGETDITVFSWDMRSPRQAGDDVVVRVLSVPLEPGRDAVEFDISEVRVNCARRAYVIAYEQSFRANGTAATPVRPSRSERRPPLAMRRVEGPVAVFFPFICGEREPPAPRALAEAAEMARESRSYVLSGTSEWVRRGRPEATPD